MISKKKLLTGAALTLMALPAQAELSANIGVVSKYILRGITEAPESDVPAVQGGIDWSGGAGFYAGYWGSSLSYGEGPNGFENDYYAGWAGDLGSLNFNAGIIYYQYMELDDADAPELTLSLGIGPISVGAKYLLDDVTWGNEGDTYVTLGYAQDLPRDFTFSALAGYYLYEAQGEFVQGGEHGFRHLDLTITHPIADTGAVMRFTYVIGGDDRAGADQGNAVVLGLKYGFGL